MVKTKLLFLCSRFGGGGAEMHLLRVLTHADFDKFEIHLALTRDGGNYEQRLPLPVTIHHLTKGGGSSIGGLIKAYKPFKKLVATLKPQAVISVMDPQNLMLTHIKKSVKNFPPILILCQNAPLKNLSNEGLRGKLFLNLIPKWYQHANKVIAICKGVRTELKEKLKIQSPITVIYNAGYDESYQERASQPLSSSYTVAENQLVCCGRLNRQKGFDILLNALHLIKNDVEFNMWILGEGELKDELISQRNSLGLEDKVQFLGFQSNPYQFFKNAEIFVLSSRWEGFGNVLTEAMICDCAVVSTECDFGPNEIITNNTDGILCAVEDAESLGAAIKKTITDVEFRKKITHEGHKRAEAFASEEISIEYFKQICEVINGVAKN